MFDLTGQVALVTGSSRGIGYAAAQALGRQGATVVLNGRNPDTLKQAAAALQNKGIDVRTAIFDVADINQTTQAIDQCLKALGKIDILFANAGVQHRESLLTYSQMDFERVIFTNLTAQWALGRHLVEAMSREGYGRIIFTGSITALRGRKGVTAYTAAKSAVHGMVRQWAAELATSGVTVNAIAPGYIRTELTKALWTDENFTRWLEDRVPQQRWGSPEDVSSAIVFLAARESGFMTGQVLTVDGGMTATL